MANSIGSALRASLAAACLLFLPAPAQALTADEVLKLRAAGVSDETIQKMLDSEKDSAAGVPQNMVDQEYATRHQGSWNLPDGSVVLSTGKSQQPGFDPTIPQSNPYPISVYPYVFGGGGGMPGPPGPAGPGPVMAPR